jgi:DNA repair exonuclease SbcCD ATPase subunit
MSREIPRAVKDEAFKLWLLGYSYREIRDRTGMSLGAINQLITGARKETPDLDDLRELNAILREYNSTIHDAARGAKLLERLNGLGVGLTELEAFMEAVGRISSERGVEASGFADAAVRLVDLERRAGKAHHEILRDFEDRLSRIRELEAEADKLRDDTKRLGEERARLDAELGTMRDEIRRLAGAREALRQMDLDKLVDLAIFGRDKGAMDAKIAELRREVDRLKMERRHLLSQMNRIRDEISGLTRLGSALRADRLTLPCKSCQMLGVSIDLATLENMIRTGLWGSNTCVFCGQLSTYTAWEAAWFLAQLFLPALHVTRSVVKKRAG